MASADQLVARSPTGLASAPDGAAPLYAQIREQATQLSEPVFSDLPTVAVAAATRVLNEVRSRVRRPGGLSPPPRAEEGTWA